MRARSTPADPPPARSTRIRPVPCEDSERSTCHQHRQRANAAWQPIMARSRKARRSASTPSRAVRGNAAGEPSQQLLDLANDPARRGDRRPRRRKPFEAMPQASRVASWSTWPAIRPGEAIGVHAVASPSRQCRRRAESAAARPGQRSCQARRSASPPSRAVRGNAAGEPSQQLLDLASVRDKRGDRRPRRREPGKAMP